MSLNIEPKEVFDWFYQLNQIPRCSGNEKEVSDFLVKFAKDRNLEVIQDEALNVIIKKKPSKGYENSKPVIIQGHMDMVCVAEDGIEHDFDKDPIDMTVDGDYLKAKGTTLGGDDGIAVAYAMAILDGDYNHPPLEVLITTSEETGMDGAQAIKKGQLEGEIMLNIDSEEEGIFLVSCAGGVNVNTTFKAAEEDLSSQGLKITLDGFLGGHSGQEIDKKRANSNIVMFRLLNKIASTGDIRISSIEGGSKHNAIPSKTQCIIAISDQDTIQKELEKEFEKIKSEYKDSDPDINMTIEKVSVDKAITGEDTKNILSYYADVKDGLVAMSKDIEGLAETSLNNAVLTQDATTINMESSLRSSNEKELDKLIKEMEDLGEKYDAKVEVFSRYPAWQFEEESEVREVALKTYKELFDKDATYSAIHAGLECGLLKKVLPDCDMISYGPDMHDVHSPKERINISSTQRMWDFTKKLLENLK